MSSRPLLVAVALQAIGCSVAPLSLEGKQCPCTNGYVCDTLTNRCLATNDGGGIIDSPAATQCLPAPSGEAELYRYGGTFDWQESGGTWAGDATEFTQTSSTAQEAFAYKTAANLTAAANYRVIATMRQVTPGSGSPSLGIVLRAQLADRPRYACEWSAKNRELRIVSYASGGGTTLGAAAISPAANLPMTFTMEASVDGSTLGCCIRELSDAKLPSVTDPAMALASGYPGITTSRMGAAFGSFVVFQRP